MTGDGVICCAVGAEQYAFRSNDVRQIARSEQVRGGMREDGSVGRLSVDGREVPVFALGAALGRETAAAAIVRGRHVAVTGEGDAAAGWLVDRIARTTIPDDVALLVLPSVVGAPATSWFEGSLPLEDRTVLLLSPSGLTKGGRESFFEKGGRESFLEPRRNFPQAAGSADMVVLFSTPALPSSDVSRFALSARRLAAVVPTLALTHVPGSAAHVAGVACWRKSIVTAIDYRGSGDHDDLAEGRRWMLVHATHALGDGLLALRVDPNVTLHRATADDRQSPERSKSSFVLGVFEIEQERVGFLQLGFLASVKGTDQAQINQFAC